MYICTYEDFKRTMVKIIELHLQKPKGRFSVTVNHTEARTTMYLCSSFYEENDFMSL